MWTYDAKGNLVDSNVNTYTTPGTQYGSGTYGAVAGATTSPSPSYDLSTVYPNLTKSNEQASANILSGLQGNLSTSTINAIQDAAARYGISSGMGTSGLSKNLSLRDLGLNSEAVQSKALSDYNTLLGTTSKTQTVSPETQIALSQSNNALAAQANPQDATTYALDLYNQYLNSTKSAAGGTGGTTTTKLAGNAGGSGTTSPFQVTGEITPTAGATGSVSTPTATSTGGAYTPVTGNTGIAGWDSQPGTDITGGAGNNDTYDWQTILADAGLLY